MDYGDISTKFEQGIGKLQKLYALMTVMGIALLILSWFADVIDDDIVPFSTYMSIPPIFTSLFGVLMMILATVGTYGLRIRKKSFYKGVYYGCLIFMVMCFIGCLLALTCYIADYKMNLASFRRAAKAYEHNKIAQITVLPAMDEGSYRRYPAEVVIKAENALHQVCLLLSLCLLLSMFILAALCISMRTTLLEMQECSDILLRAARSLDPSNMLLSANQPRAYQPTPRISRRNNARRADFNTVESGIMLETEEEQHGMFNMENLSAKRNRENEESFSVIKDNEIKVPKCVQNEIDFTEEILI